MMDPGALRVPTTASRRPKLLPVARPGQNSKATEIVLSASNAASSKLLPREPEVHGLVALMEFQASRFAARLTRSGAPILLGEQDRCPACSSG